MALKRSGISLVAENYQAYVTQLNNLNKLHKEVFNANNFKGYEEASKKIGQSFKDMPKNFPKTSFKDPAAEAMKLQEALKILGETGKFSLSKISEETLKVNQALATVRKSGKFDIGNIEAPKSLLERFNNVIKPAIGNVGELTNMLTGMVAKFTLVAVTLKLVNDVMQFFTQSLALAQRNETLAVSLQEIGSQAGYSAKQIKLATQLLNKQGITTQAAQQSLLLMARANISWSEASHLAQIAQGSAVVAGMNSSQAFERLVRGIQKMEPELLDELGITLRRTDAYEKYAATIGKNAKQLDETEKKQAILNAIYEQSESVIGVYSAAMETSGKQQASLARYIEETQTNMGKLMLSTAGARIEMETRFWKAAQQLSKGLSEMAPFLKIIGAGFEEIDNKMSLSPEVLKGYKEAQELLQKFALTGTDASRIIMSAIDEINKGASAGELQKSVAEQFKAAGSSQAEATQQAKMLIEMLNNYSVEIKKLEESRGFWENLGEGIFNFSKYGIIALIAVGTAIETFYHNTTNWIKILTLGFQSLAAAAQNDFGKAAALGIEMADRIKQGAEKIDFNKLYVKNMAAMVEKFPEFGKKWEDLNEKIKGDSGDLKLPVDPSAIDDGTEALEKQIEALEALSSAYESIQDIQKNYQKEIADAEKDYQKGLVDAEKKYQADKVKMIADQGKKLLEFDAETARKRAKMLEDFAFDQQQSAKKFELTQAQNKESFNLKQSQDEQKFYDENKRAYRAYQLSMMQQQRQFQLSDRRMRADGDVLALMEARENFALQQQENKENFDAQVQNTDEAYFSQQKIAIDNFKLQEEQAKQSFAQQTEMQREEFQKRMADFDENAALEREKMLAANAQALVDLDVKYEEEKAKLLEQYQEKVAAAEERRQEEMTALGDALKEEAKVTEEGMKVIQDKVAEVFGEGAGGDALIKGWTDRTKDEISALVDQINADIARMKATMEAGGNIDLSQDTGPSSSAGSYPGGKPGFNSSPAVGNPQSRPGALNRIGARHGYQGTVTGPATFDVEPGVREHVSFTPASRFGNVRVGGRVGVDVTGMSSGVSPQVEESVANTFLEEIKVAVRRLSRRHG